MGEDKLTKELPIDPVTNKIETTQNIKKDADADTKKSKTDFKQNNQNQSLTNLKVKDTKKLSDSDTKKKNNTKNIRKKSDILSTSKSRYYIHIIICHFQGK